MMATILPPRHRFIALLATLVLMMAASGASAQSYSFSRDTGTYSDLQGATLSKFAIGDSVNDDLIDVGESFSFFRRQRSLHGSSPLHITGFGNLRIDDDTSIIIIDGIFGELAARDTSSHISYLLDGTPGDRVMKVQWKNAGFLGGAPADSVNFQIWLHQRSGVIEIRMGPGSMPTLATAGGWMGAFISPPDFRYMIEKAWIVGDPAKPVFDTKKNFVFDRLTALPPAGTIFRLTPTGSLGVRGKTKPTGALELLPNPTTDRVELRIGGPIGRDADVRVLDLLGSLVRRASLDRSSGRVDLSGLPTGSYLVELIDGAARYAGIVAKR